MDQDAPLGEDGDSASLALRTGSSGGRPADAAAAADAHAMRQGQAPNPAAHWPGRHPARPGTDGWDIDTCVTCGENLRSTDGQWSHVDSRLDPLAAASVRHLALPTPHGDGYTCIECEYPVVYQPENPGIRPGRWVHVDGRLDPATVDPFLPAHVIWGGNDGFDHQCRPVKDAEDSNRATCYICRQDLVWKNPAPTMTGGWAHKPLTSSTAANIKTQAALDWLASQGLSGGYASQTHDWTQRRDHRGSPEVGTIHEPIGGVREARPARATCHICKEPLIWSVEAAAWLHDTERLSTSGAAPPPNDPPRTAVATDEQEPGEPPVNETPPGTDAPLPEPLMEPEDYRRACLASDALHTAAERVNQAIEAIGNAPVDAPALRDLYERLNSLAGQIGIEWNAVLGRIQAHVDAEEEASTPEPDPDHVPLDLEVRTEVFSTSNTYTKYAIPGIPRLPASTTVWRHLAGDRWQGPIEHEAIWYPEDTTEPMLTIHLKRGGPTSMPDEYKVVVTF